jgi:hypothetical protein
MNVDWDWIDQAQEDNQRATTNHPGQCIMFGDCKWEHASDDSDTSEAT